MTAIGILGAGGRMGRAIAAAADAEGLAVAGAIGRAGDVAALAVAADVLIDFSAPAALSTHLDAAVAAATPILIGTTGLDAGHRALIDLAARRIALVEAANTSLGVAVLSGLVEQAARALGTDWDIEIVEMHHRHKIDAPSGTALLLGGAAASGRSAGPRDLDRADRASGRAREEGGIYYASLRGGSVAGDHSVVFAGDGERIELVHRAESRAIFAKGALRAATWLAPSRAPGRYTMADVLGLA
jgi:4-hydroxy-tetrahydrodipicolinate reductase